MIKFEMPENKDEDRQYKEGLIKLFSNYKKGEIASDNFIQEIKNKAIFLNKEKYEEAVMGFWPENLESLLNLSFAVYNENLRIYINKDEIPEKFIDQIILHEGIETGYLSEKKELKDEECIKAHKAALFEEYKFIKNKSDLEDYHNFFMKYIDNLLSNHKDNKKIVEMLETAKKERENVFFSVKEELSELDR